MSLRLGSTRNASTHDIVTQHGHATTQDSGPKSGPQVDIEPDEVRDAVQCRTTALTGHELHHTTPTTRSKGKEKHGRGVVRKRRRKPIVQSCNAYKARHSAALKGRRGEGERTFEE